MLEHAEPVAEARAVALVDDDEIEEVGVVVLVDLLAVELLVEVLVVGEEDLADQVLAPERRILVDLRRVRAPKKAAKARYA